MPRKCAACGIEKVKKQYSKNQWAKKPADSKCLHCIENGGRLQAFSPPEPNVVTGWQYHQYDSERYVYIGKDEDGEPQFLDNGPKSGHSKPQGATRGNSTETLPVLLIQGLGMFEPNDCFISNGFKNAAKEAGIAFVSVECGGHQSYQDCLKLCPKPMRNTAPSWLPTSPKASKNARNSCPVHSANMSSNIAAVYCFPPPKACCGANGS